MCLLVEGSEETVAVEEEEELGWKGKVKLEMAYALWLVLIDHRRVSLRLDRELGPCTGWGGELWHAKTRIYVTCEAYFYFSFPFQFPSIP
jgi:hypothetical protein